LRVAAPPRLSPVGVDPVLAAALDDESLAGRRRRWAPFATPVTPAPAADHDTVFVNDPHAISPVGCTQHWYRPRCDFGKVSIPPLRCCCGLWLHWGSHRPDWCKKNVI